MSDLPRVLFLEDNDGVRISLTKALKLQGLDVTSVATVEEGLQACEANEFENLLCDYEVNGENGLIVAKKFHDTFPEADIAIFTGVQNFMQEEVVQEFLHANRFTRPFRLIQKPIDRNVIYDWISETALKSQKRRKN